MATDRRSMLVTFKRKDQRPEHGKDKIDIVRSVLAPPRRQSALLQCINTAAGIIATDSSRGASCGV